MRRGEVWWGELPKPIGRRPVILLSRDEAYEVRNAITVALSTTTVRNIPVEVLLDERDGLPRKCVVNVDAISTIPKSALIKRICSLRSDKMEEINKAVKFALLIE